MPIVRVDWDYDSGGWHIARTKATKPRKDRNLYELTDEEIYWINGVTQDYEEVQDFLNGLVHKQP